MSQAIRHQQNVICKTRPYRAAPPTFCFLLDLTLDNPHSKDVEIHQQGQPLTQMFSLCINKPAIAFLCEADVTPTSSHTTERQLNQMIRELEIENGTEIAVVTVPETSPSPSPKAFTTELFNYWGIGKAESSNYKEL